MATTECKNGCVHPSLVTGQPLISCPPQCWQTYRGSRPGPAEHEEDLTVFDDLPGTRDELEEGEVSIVCDRLKKKKKKNFLRRDRKRKQVARDRDAQDVNAKETKKILAAEKKKVNGLTRILTDTR